MLMPPCSVAAPPPSGRPPESNLAPRDVAELADALVAYHAHFRPLFAREEQRHWALAYLQGQLLTLDRKSIEPMALALPDGNVQAMQQFISVGAWDAAAVLHQHQRLVAETLGDRASGVLIIDGCDFPKQGSHSVGVARQWCGALGKRANCQASVVAAYASARGYTLVDRRLFLPEAWFTEAYATRRARCGAPADLAFQTHNELAWAVIETLHRRGDLPFGWVTFDEAFGRDTRLLDQVAGRGLSYLAEVPHATRVWRVRPQTAAPPAKRRGRRPRRVRVRPDQAPPVRVDELAATLPRSAWRRRVIKEGSKGPIVAEVARVRAVALRDGLPGPAVWVVVRRTLGETPELKTYLSNASAVTPFGTLVRVSGMRWPVESAIQEGKDDVGMDQYEVRGWVGWRHHLTMSLLAHHFLVWLRRRLGGEITGADGGAGAGAAASQPAPTGAGCRDGAGAHHLHPNPELQSLLFAPPPHAAPAVG
jgi:SRSO17 transposase